MQCSAQFLYLGCAPGDDARALSKRAAGLDKRAYAKPPIPWLCSSCFLAVLCYAMHMLCICNKVGLWCESQYR